MSKEQAQREADFYNMGADYSFASIVQTAEGWKVTVKYY